MGDRGPSDSGAGGRQEPIQVSRASKRPRQRVARGARQAEQLLSEPEIRERLRLDPTALAALRACCSSRPPRNALAIVSAIRTRLEWSQPKPKQEIDHNVTVTHAGLVAAAADAPPKVADDAPGGAP